MTDENQGEERAAAIREQQEAAARQQKEIAAAVGQLFIDRVALLDNVRTLNERIAASQASIGRED